MPWFVQRIPLVVVMLTATLTAQAQDRASVVPGMPVLLENACVRVYYDDVRVGETIPMHTHPAYVVYTMAAFRVRIRLADGTERISARDSGVAYLNTPITHSVENLGTTPVHNLVVEMKQGASCALHPQSQRSTAADSAGISLVGSWEVVSRLDRTSDGRTIDEPSLGADPIALLMYDAAGHVSAQLMRRSRRSRPAAATSPTEAPGRALANNSAAIGGYDAYFGTYAVDVRTHTVTHHFNAALNPTDVGREVTRHFRLEGDQLVLDYETRAANGEPVTRTLRFRRVG